MSEEQCTAVTRRARHIFTQLNASGIGAARWGDVGNIGQDYYRSEMYSFFPDLRLCELDWKVNRLATETYSSWYRKRKGKLVMPTKQEPAKDIVIGASGGENERPTTTQLTKRPILVRPPLEPAARAKKVKLSCNAPKAPPAQAPASPKICAQPTSCPDIVFDDLRESVEQLGL